LKSLEFYCG